MRCLQYLESLPSAGGLGNMHRWLQAASRLLHLPVHKVFYHLGPREASRRQAAPQPACTVCRCHLASAWSPLLPSASWRLAHVTQTQSSAGTCPHPPHSPLLQVCKLYTASIQVLCGCLAPMLYHFCQDAGFAVQYAEQRGISPGSPRLRWARLVHNRLCATAWLPVRLLAVLPVTAGVVVLLSDILPAEFVPAPALFGGG